MKTLQVDYFLETGLSGVFGVFPRYFDFWRKVLLLVSIALNVMIIGSFTEKFGDDQRLVP